MVGIALSVVILSTVIESLAEYLLGIWWRPWNPEIRGKILKALTLAAGITVAVWAKLDILALVNINIPILGTIITGTIMGRGSVAVHAFIEKWLAKK